MEIMLIRLRQWFKAELRPIKHSYSKISDELLGSRVGWVRILKEPSKISKRAGFNLQIFYT